MPGALDGIRVLDLCIILAGPTCGRTLAEYGADILKIDALNRRPGIVQWIDVGRGKRSICLDLSKPEGLEVFYKLVETADVVLEGFRKGVADRMGIGYGQLRNIKPDIICVSINAFGQSGPWALRPGFDQNAQAATGMQIRIGGRDGTPAPPAYTFNDYGTGMMAAYGVMMALLEREQTGQGQHIEAALSYTASGFASPFLLDYPGFERREVEGAHARGYNALSRLYEASDGWLYLGATGKWDKLTTLEPFSNLRSRDDELLSKELEAIFKQKPVAEWLGLLRGAGVSAARNALSSDFFEDEYARAHELVIEEKIADYGTFDHGGVAPQLNRTPAKAGSVPLLGADTEAVLTEADYSIEQIEALRMQGVIPPAEGLQLG